MTTQPDTIPTTAGNGYVKPRCHFPRYFDITMPPPPPRPAPRYSQDSRQFMLLQEISKQRPTEPRHTYSPDGVVEKGIRDYLKRYGEQLASQDLANWTIEPQLKTADNGDTTLELFIDPAGNPVFSWTRTADNFLTKTTIEEHLTPDDWLIYENPRWKHWYDDNWHLKHNPKALEEKCDCWPPWEAGTLEINDPLPRQKENYSLTGTTSDYIFEAARHLTTRMVLRAAEAASEYHENSSIAFAIDDVMDETTLNKLSIIASTALAESIKNQERRKMLETTLHYSRYHVAQYDGRWTPEKEEKPKPGDARDTYADSDCDHCDDCVTDEGCDDCYDCGYEDEHDLYERHSAKLDARYSMQETTQETNEETFDAITATGAANNLVLTRILNPENIKSLSLIKRKHRLAGHESRPAKGFTNHDVEIIQAVMRNQPAVTQLQEHSPDLAALYLKAFARPKHAFVHAGQIIRHMRGQYKLKPAEWKLLCRLAPHAKVIRNPSYVGAAKAMTGAVRMLATANRPEAELDTLVMLAGQGNLHEKHWTKPPKNRREQHRLAWTRTMNAFLAQGGPERKPNHLIEVSDAITGTLRADENWGPGDWETMLNRSARWHRMVRERRKKKSGRAKWKPLVEEYQDGDLTISPITNQTQLRYAADQLDNCLDNYYEACTKRGTRIYTYTSGADNIIGATELIRTQSGWMLGQTETIYDGMDEEDQIFLAANRLLQKHQDATTE